MGAGLALGTGIAQLIRIWRFDHNPEYHARELRAKEASLRAKIARDQQNMGTPGRCHLRDPAQALRSHTEQLNAVRQEMTEPMAIERRLQKQIARDRERIAHRGLCELEDPNDALARHERKLQDITQRRQAALPQSPYAAGSS